MIKFHKKLLIFSKENYFINYTKQVKSVIYTIKFNVLWDILRILIIAKYGKVSLLFPVAYTIYFIHVNIDRVCLTRRRYRTTIRRKTNHIIVSKYYLIHHQVLLIDANMYGYFVVIMSFSTIQFS